MKGIGLLLLAVVLCSCGGKKQDVDPELYKQGIEMAKEKTARYIRENFIKDYEALDGYEKDSVFYITLTEVREGTDLDHSAMETFDAARSKGIHFKACVILDREGNEIGRYE